MYFYTSIKNVHYNYEMLIKLYIKNKNLALAKKYFQEGIKEYPESYTINQLASKLIGK